MLTGRLERAAREQHVEPISPATPLVALKAVAIDTETTGLDPRSARIVQLAALRLDGVKAADDAPAGQLVNPGIAIPPAATAVHGITDAMVAQAPAFAEIWPAFAERLGARVVVAYHAGFDVAILKRECTLAGIAWPDPPRLCVRALALCAAPSLKDSTLEGLCRWLDITIDGRHTASGDTMAAAAIWARLLPMLMQKGVRTLGEAAAAVAAREVGGHASDGIFGRTAEPDVLIPSGENPSFRLDSYAYRHRVGDVMSAPAVFAPFDMPLRQAARLLIERRLSSVLVQKPGHPVGIVTERDLLRGLAAAENADALPIGDLASRPLLTVPADMHL